MVESESETSPWKADDRFRVVVDSSPTAIIVSERGGRIVLVNPRAQQMFGYTKEEFLKLGIDSLVPMSKRSGHGRLRAGYHAAPETRSMGMGRDLYAQRKDGAEIPVEVGLTPLPGEHGNLVLSSIVDISERKKAEESLQQYAGELQFQAEILQSIYDAVFFVDDRETIQLWNAGAARIFRIAEMDAVGHSLEKISFDPENDPLIRRILPLARQTGLVEDEVRQRISIDREIHLRIKAIRFVEHGREGVVICASDITEQKKLERELINLAEEEQRRIGQDIHDDLCSQLSGIGCLTQALEQQLRSSDPAKADTMAGICEMISHAGLKAREIARGLAPSVLENHGLPEALRELADQNKAVFGTDCIVKVLPPTSGESLGLDVAVQIYRIAQEALSNAVRHSDADRIEVRLSEREGRIMLAVTDNGKGMPHAISSSGIGLSTMRRRAGLIDADLTLDSSPGAGTELKCVLDL